MEKYIIILLIAIAFIKGCDNVELIDPPGIEVNMPADSLVFAVIGDYGLDSDNEEAVANMVKSWNPDFIITTGDNNYQNGEMSTIKDNISKYYGDFIYNYDAEEKYRCNGIAFEEQINRFFPSPGNHDTYGVSGLKPYLNFFTLPGNEEYYSFTWGDMDFFSLISTSAFITEQEKWLEESILQSGKSCTVVYFHHSPYSSGPHGNERKMQLDYHAMGVDVVFTGHDHLYSHIEKNNENGLHYVIIGSSGKSLYECGAEPLNTENFLETCYDDDFGAVRGTWNGGQLNVEFLAVGDPSQPFDRFLISKY